MASSGENRSFDRHTSTNYAKEFSHDTQLSDESGTQERLRDETQVLDDQADAFGDELVNIDGGTQVLENSFDAEWRRLKSDTKVVGQHKDSTDTELVGMDYPTQIVDDPEDVFHNQLLCTENLDLDALYSGCNSLNENDQCKSSSDSLMECTGHLNHDSGATLAHTAKMDNDTSGYVPPKFTEIRVESLRASAAAARRRLENNNEPAGPSQSSKKQDDKESGKSGYVPLRFTKILVESLIAPGLAARNRALSSVATGSFCSLNTSHSQQELTEKENEVPLRVSPPSVQETDDEGYAVTAFREPKDAEFSNRRKVKSSVVRRLFAEEIVPHTEAFGTRVSDDTETELPAWKRDNAAAGLNYIDSQEPTELEHAKAVDFVNKFLKTNILDIEEDDHRSFHGINTDSVIAHGQCMQNLAKANIRKNSDGLANAFDWDDNNEDDSGGAFFCKMKEGFPKKGSDLQKYDFLPKCIPLDSEQLENNINGKKSKLSYSDGKLLSPKMKKIIKTKKLETNAERKTSNSLNTKPIRGTVASRKNNSAMPSAGQDSRADTASTMKTQHIAFNDNQVYGNEKGSSKDLSEGWTRKSLFSKEYNLRKRVYPGMDNINEYSAPSLQMSDGLDASHITPIEQQMEVLTEAGRKTRGGNAHALEPVTSKAYSFAMDQSHVGQIELVNPKQLKPKASGRSVPDQTNRKGNNADARHHRSTRLNKCLKVGDSLKQQINQGSDNCTFEQGGLESNPEALHLPLQDGYVDLIEQSAVSFPSKRRKTTGSISNDHARDESIDRPFMMNKDQICLYKPVVQNVLEQSKPASNNTTSDGLAKSSSCMRGVRRRSCRLNGSSAHINLSLHANKKQQSSETSLDDTITKLESSLTRSVKIPYGECITPKNSIKPIEEASPICIGKEYYNISCKPDRSRSNLKKENCNVITSPQNVTSDLKDSRKGRGMDDVRVLFSRHLDIDTLKHQEKILNQLGASIASSISDATHFVADKFVRTRNMLEAIALGKPVVTALWLVSCSARRCHIDEESYILRDGRKEKKFGFSMPVSLYLASRKPLLQNKRVFITPNTKPGRDIITCLVKAVHGQVIGRIGRSALSNHNVLHGLLILACKEDFAICVPFLEEGATVYSSELLLNGIVTQRLEYERYRLFNDRVRRTRSTLWLKKDGKKFLPVNRNHS